MLVVALPSTLFVAATETLGADVVEGVAEARAVSEGLAVVVTDGVAEAAALMLRPVVALSEGVTDADVETDTVVVAVIEAEGDVVGVDGNALPGGQLQPEGHAIGAVSTLFVNCCHVARPLSVSVERVTPRLSRTMTESPCA